MCVSMVDIQSPTAEIRRGKKKKKKPQDKIYMACPITQSGNKLSACLAHQAARGQWHQAKVVGN